MTYPQCFLCFNNFISFVLPRVFPKTPSNSPYVFQLAPVFYLAIPLRYLSRYSCVVMRTNSFPIIWSILLHCTDQESLSKSLLSLSSVAHRSLLSPFVSHSFIGWQLVFCRSSLFSIDSGNYSLEMLFEVCWTPSPINLGELKVSFSEPLGTNFYLSLLSLLTGFLPSYFILPTVVRPLEFSWVLHVPDLRNSLLSVLFLTCQKGWHIIQWHWPVSDGQPRVTM